MKAPCQRINVTIPIEKTGIIRPPKRRRHATPEACSYIQLSIHSYFLDKLRNTGTPSRAISKHAPRRSTKPLLGNPNSTTVPVADPPSQRWVRLFGLVLLLLLRLGDGAFGDFGGGDSPASLGGLFSEKSVYCVHLCNVKLVAGEFIFDEVFEAYLFFFVSLLAQVLSPSCHFGSAHCALFCC